MIFHMKAKVIYIEKNKKTQIFWKPQQPQKFLIALSNVRPTNFARQCEWHNCIKLFMKLPLWVQNVIACH